MHNVAHFLVRSQKHRMMPLFHWDDLECDLDLGCVTLST